MLIYQILFTILLLSISSFARETKIKIISNSRHDSIDYDGVKRQNRYQQRFRLFLDKDINSKVKFNSMISTGEHYGNDWATVFNQNSGERASTPLNIRHFNFQYHDKNAEVKLGAIEGFRLYGSGGVGNTGGWLDGLSLRYNLNDYSIKLTGGSLTDFDHVDFFTRNKIANFSSVIFSQKKDSLNYEIEYQNFMEKDNLASNFEYDAKTFTFSIDALYDLQLEASNFSSGIKMDLGEVLFHDFTQRLKFSLFYSSLSKKLTDRNHLYGLYFDDGEFTIIGLSGKIDSSNNYSWFLRDAVNADKYRFDCGLSLKF